MSQDVLFEQTGPTAIITLNRPDKLNAWTEAMRNELIDYLESLKGNDEVRTVILTGSGRAFCAGQDLAETASMNPEDHESAEAWIDGFDRLYRAVRNLDQITIAAVNGVAAGSGFQYSLLADLRVGDSKVRMGQPEVLSGIPSITGIWAMWSILGKSKTSQFVLTGELVDAAEAQRLGLLNYLADDGGVLAYATDLAARLSLLPPGAVRLTKNRLRSLEDDDLSDAMAEAKRVHREAYGTGEPQREMARFLAGPALKGRDTKVKTATQDRYTELRNSHRWEVPELYNMAVDVADRHPRDKRALILESAVEGQREVSWGEIQDRSRQIAASLQKAGIKKGDRVAVLLPQRSDTPAAYLGVLRTGAILVTMSLLWAAEPIRFRLEDSGASVIIAEESAKHLFKDFEGTFIDIDSPAIKEASTEFQDVETTADDPALIFYTSGTTGRAKGIVHAHRTLLGHNEFEYCHQIGDGDVFYGAGDWAWSLAKLMGPLRLGATHLVFRPSGGFNPAALLDSMSRHRITSALVNPTFLRKMREDVPDAGTHFPLHLRTVCSSNEPLTPDLITWFEGQYGVTLLDYYGSTESYPLLGNYPDVPVKPGSMGKPLPGWEVRLLDENEQEVPAGETGEVCLRAQSNPQFPLGYWNMPEASATAFGGDWYHTKDQAYADEDGYFWFLGRTDDVIKTSGYRVGPYELEAVIRELDPVRDVSVTGVPDELRGQSIKAWIELMPGHTGGADLSETIVAHVKENFSRFAYPRFIEYVSALPKSATGKVQRAQLRELPHVVASPRFEGQQS